MAITRVFLGWDAPCLQLVAEYLAHRYIRDEVFNLESLILAAPVTRALRRLTEILADTAQANRALLVLPQRMLSFGELPELLYRPELPPASALAEICAWRTGLHQTPQAELAILVPQPPKKDDERAYLGLARMLNRLWNTLAAGGVTFEEVPGKAEGLDLFEDEERWRVLAKLFARYKAALADAGLSDQQSNRIEALHRSGLSLKGELVLIAASDIHPLFKTMIRALEGSVTSLVFAPQSTAEGFDEVGGLNKRWWAEQSIELPDEIILQGDGPERQAACALEGVASFRGSYSAEEVSVGVGDPLLTPFIEEAFKSASVPARAASGRKLSDAAPLKLLSGVARFCSARRFEDLAALLRHPEFEFCLRSRLALEGEVLSAFDRFHHQHLQSIIEGGLPADRYSGPKVAAACSGAKELLAEFLVPTISLSQLPDRVRNLVLALYGERSFHLDHQSDRIVAEASRAIADELARFLELPPALDLNVAPADALQLLLDLLGTRALPPEAGDAAIEILGWLELQLDDAPALIVTGLHEGCVPQAITADPFLPDALRSALGLLDNDGRFARDIFALKSMCASKKAVRVVVGRRSPTGDPVLPSRLLLQCADAVKAARVERLYAEANESDTMAPLFEGSPAKSAFEVPPRPTGLVEVPRALAVTAFKDYLACRYRFYLKHMLKLERETDSAREMEGDVYGALVHAVVQRFAASAANESKDEAVIARELRGQLGTLAAEQFGSHPLPAVVVQLRQLQHRLDHFARAQAERRMQGWEIWKTEIDLGKESAPFMVDGIGWQLRGRVDRIDRRVDREGEQFAIIDYKTAERGDPPEKTHRSRGEWRDLQLPLYHHLFKSWYGKECNSPILLGYCVLPRDLAQTGFVFAEWNEEELAQALDEARMVLRGVAAQEFWPPSPRLQPYDDFAVILGTQQFAAAAAEEEGARV